jgi:hypothetical protein
MVDAGERAHLPIACTLGPADGIERMQQWHALLASNHLGTTRPEGYLEVRFRDDDAAETELPRLVAAERECCSFVDWSVAAREGQLVLTLSGDDAALASFSF